MYIDGFGEAVQREIEDRINDATKYNSGIFKLTELLLFILNIELLLLYWRLK